jgi:phosphotransferase system IIB component
MPIEASLTRLRALVADAEDHKNDPTRLADLWQPIKEILDSELAPALQAGAAFPLPSETRENIAQLVQKISSLEQSLQHRSKVIDGFVPSKSGTPKA